MVRCRPFRASSPFSRSSQSMRFACTVESPVASANSAWMTGKSKLNQSTRPTARRRTNISQIRCPRRCKASRCQTFITHSRVGDGLVHKRAPPQRPRSAGVPVREADHAFLRDHRHDGGHHGADGVIHTPEGEDALVADVTPDEVGHDLSVAIQSGLGRHPRSDRPRE